MFSQGSEKLTKKGLIQINIITDVFKKVLPCFSGPPTFLRKSNVVNNSKKAWEDLQKKMKHNSYCS